MSNGENAKLEVMIHFNLPRVILGILAAALSFFLYFEYCRFLINEGFALILRLLIFIFGQLICLIFLIWSGVLISKITICPHCKEGYFILPLAEIKSWLPALPFSSGLLTNFILNNKESLLLKRGSDKLEGQCPCCGTEYIYEDNQLKNIKVDQPVLVHYPY